MKKSVKIIIAVVVVIAILVVGFVVFQVKHITDNAVDEIIPVGYIEEGGYSNSGIDLEAQNYYKYNELPALSADFELIDDTNIGIVQNVTGLLNLSKPSLLPAIESGDYFYLKSYNQDGEEVAFDYSKQAAHSNFIIYYYNTSDNTLYKIVQVD